MLIVEGRLQGAHHAIRIRLTLGLDHSIHLDQRGMFLAVHHITAAQPHHAPDHHTHIGEAEQLEENPPAPSGTLLPQPFQSNSLEHFAFPVRRVLQVVRHDGDDLISVGRAAKRRAWRNADQVYP